jgi:hypothetical protein
LFFDCVAPHAGYFRYAVSLAGHWKQFVKQSTKAALLSGLVFPGFGHLYLKQYVRGVIIAGISAVSLYFIVSVAVDTAAEVMAKVQSGEVPPDAAAITELVSRQSQATEASTNMASMLLLGLWIIGILDSYRLGRSGDQGKEISSKDEKGKIL